jgi:hypothetical protein
MRGGIKMFEKRYYGVRREVLWCMKRGTMVRCMRRGTKVYEARY